MAPKHLEELTIEPVIRCDNDNILANGRRRSIVVLQTSRAQLKATSMDPKHDGSPPTGGEDGGVNTLRYR
jgi:hypothetical protein